MLKAENLSKSFGETEAVKDLSLRLEKGEVVGLLGPNGAGKTTTMQMLSGLLKPDSGSVETENSLREDVSVAFQETDYDSKLKVKEFLRMMAVMNDEKVSVEEVIERVDLEGESETYVKNISGGTKKKLNIASGLLKDPEYLLLDEPTAGLDPNAKETVRETVEELTSEKGILVSTHIMEDAEKLCDRVIIVDKGEKIVSGRVEELIDRVDTEYILEAEGEVPEDFRERAVASDGFFELSTDAPHDLLKQLVDSGAIDELDKISIKRPGLEDVFFKFAGRRYDEEDS